VRGLLRSEDGVALPVAAGMLMVVSILVVGFFTVAMRVNATSVDDRSSKRALAAAEAGLQSAVYRLNQLSRSAPAQAGSCLTTTWVPTTGECPGFTEALGNGAQYTYYVTQQGATCPTTLPGLAPTAEDRCITSIGTVNGVSRRIQTRVVSRIAIPDFGQVGMVGKSLVYGRNGVSFGSDVGSNSHVELVNSVSVSDDDGIAVDGAVRLLQGGTYVSRNEVTVAGGVQTTTIPFEMPMPDFAYVQENNDNASLDAATPDSVFDPITRQFSYAIDGTSLTLPPGTYHVCRFHLARRVNLRFSHTGDEATKIFVDSPSRPGSWCAGQAAPAGTFLAENEVDINKEVGEREELLDVYMYGTSSNDTSLPGYTCAGVTSPQMLECPADFLLQNATEFYGSLYAPQSTAEFHNSVVVKGSVAADRVHFFNAASFSITGEIIDKLATLRPAERKGWIECPPDSTVPADPESGC
jgi:Tfp pilus assembly protein PilX